LIIIPFCNFIKDALQLLHWISDLPIVQDRPPKRIVLETALQFLPFNFCFNRPCLFFNPCFHLQYPLIIISNGDSPTIQIRGGSRNSLCVLIIIHREIAMALHQGQ
jgi:hypothetical protein